MSLSSFMYHIIHNLQSKDSLTHLDVRSRLHALSGSSNLCSKGKALNASSYEVNKCNIKENNSEKQNPTRPAKTEPPKRNQSYYCKKHKYTYEDYRDKFCNRLKSARDNSEGSAPSPALLRDVIPYHANLTVTEHDYHRVALIISSLLHPVPTIPSGSAFKTAIDNTYEVWISDTGASFHIIADFSYLLEPIRWHVGLTVGGGAWLHVTHMGSVQLDREIGGSVLSVTVSDVLYVPNWNEAFLISWRKIDMLRGLRMVSEDGIITVQHKSDHSAVRIGEFMHGCYQVLPLARHNKIYAAATDVCHQALVHSLKCFCSTPTDIYADGSFLPKRTSEYFCAACAKYHSKHAGPLPVSNAQSKNPFDLINGDLLVPLTVEYLGCRKYMQTFVVDKTRHSQLNFLHAKSYAPRLIKTFRENVNTQMETYPRCDRTDTGGEFVNVYLQAYCEGTGIMH